jgi:hypothetical protein
VADNLFYPANHDHPTEEPKQAACATLKKPKSDYIYVTALHENNSAKEHLMHSVLKATRTGNITKWSQCCGLVESFHVYVHCLKNV